MLRLYLAHPFMIRLNTSHMLGVQNMPATLTCSATSQQFSGWWVHPHNELGLNSSSSTSKCINTAISAKNSNFLVLCTGLTRNITKLWYLSCYILYSIYIWGLGIEEQLKKTNQDIARAIGWCFMWCKSWSYTTWLAECSIVTVPPPPSSQLCSCMAVWWVGSVCILNRTA